jgi:hypothetical protein
LGNVIENVIENAEFGGISEFILLKGYFKVRKSCANQRERESVKFQIVPMVNNGYVSERKLKTVRDKLEISTFKLQNMKLL